MTTPRCTQPSKYAAVRIKSSTDAPIGTTAPCRTAFACMGVLLLGNSVGNSACNTVPKLCTSRDPVEVGATSDCTTLKWPDVGSAVVGEEGRYIFRGI